jgi:hypothetical protein
MSLKIVRDASRKMLNGGDDMAGGTVEERRFSAASLVPFRGLQPRWRRMGCAGSRR